MKTNINYETANKMRRAAMDGARAARLASLTDTVRNMVAVARHYNMLCLQQRKAWKQEAT